VAARAVVNEETILRSLAGVVSRVGVDLEQFVE